MNLKKWRAMTNQERVNYLRAGRIIAKPELGLVSQAKDGQPAAGVRYVATCRGILIAIQESEDLAIRVGQRWLSEWNGSLPDSEQES